MRVRLKGLNCTRKKLANGEIVIYWYAWRGGPRLNGQPGTPEFIASYNAAVANIPKSQTGTLDFILGPGRSALESGARREQKTWPLDPHEYARPGLDRKWLPRLMAKGLPAWQPRFPAFTHSMI